MLILSFSKALFAHHLINVLIIHCWRLFFTDCCPNSTRFSYKFPVSGLKQIERDGLDLLSLSDLTGLKTVTTTDYKPYFPDMGCTDSQLVYPNPEVGSRERLIDFVGDLVRRSEITVREDGKVSLSGTRREMKDILSVLAEFYLSKSSTNTRKQTVIPYFDRYVCICSYKDRWVGKWANCVFEVKTSNFSSKNINSLNVFFPNTPT